PYYLTYKAAELGYHAQVINSGRFVNDSVGFYIAKQTVKRMVAAGKNNSEARVLVMGATFKEDVEDIRNSKVADVVNEFKSYGVSVDVVDPKANTDELMHEYGFGLIPKPQPAYDAIVVAVSHNEYINLDEAYFKSIAAPRCILVDIKGLYRNKIKQLTYWSL
ncbi:MAG TPA: UDP binding domain-containing protein, partial [Bacteroidia bacterium]|nr:UDP binding domain-containing protein [Bacteroidia bacterium]